MSLEAYCNYETLDPCQDLQSETRPGSEDDEAMREQDSKNVLLDDFETLQAAFERVVGITIRTVAGSISKRSSSPSSSSSSYQHWMKSLNQHHNIVKIR